MWQVRVLLLALANVAQVVEPWSLMLFCLFPKILKICLLNILLFLFPLTHKSCSPIVEACGDTQDKQQNENQ